MADVRSVAVLRDTTHDESLEWLSDHPDALMPFAGEWVALHNCRIVAHDPSAVAVARMAREAGVEYPLLVPVMTERVLLWRHISSSTQSADIGT